MPKQPVFEPPKADRSFYDAIASSSRRPLLDHQVEVRSGFAWEVRAGQVFRLSTPEGRQVADLDIWSLHNPDEHLWSGRTRQLEGAHVTTYNRLWSTLPFMRPLATIIADTVSFTPDEHGSRVHDLLGTRCDPYVMKMLAGIDFDYFCQSNLKRAILPHGLAERDIHDPLNVFQVTGLDRERDYYFLTPSPATPGDYVEFFAEQDLLCAVSACPYGDVSVPLWGDEAGDALSVCHPLRVEVEEVVGGHLAGWVPPQPPAYRGLHGLRPVAFDPAAPREL
jgi:uncharacterized protein